MKTTGLKRYVTLLSGRDRSADRFRELSTQYYGNAYNWALRYTGNEQDAQDLVQETFMAAFRHFKTLKAASKFKGWLFRIMRNRHIKNQQQHLRYPTISMEDHSGYLAELEESARTIDTDGLYESKVAQQELHRAIENMDEKYKSPLILYYMEGYAYREIADILNIPVGTVMSRLSRGRQALKKAILQMSVPRNSIGRVIDLKSMKGRG